MGMKEIINKRKFILGMKNPGGSDNNNDDGNENGSQNSGGSVSNTGDKQSSPSGNEATGAKDI